MAVGAGASLDPPTADEAPVSAGTVEPEVSAGAAAEEVASAAAEVSLGEDAAVVLASAGAAVFTQSQMAPADFWTWRPVAIPHDLTMQPCAADWMAADWEAEHWQAKSVSWQPTPEPAEEMQGTYVRCFVRNMVGDGSPGCGKDLQRRREELLQRQGRHLERRWPRPMRELRRRLRYALLLKDLRVGPDQG